MIEIPGFVPSRRIETTADGDVIIHVQPPKLIGDYPEVSVRLTADQFERYLNWRNRGELIQEALPDLTPDTREMLMTGLCDEDFKRVARDVEED